MVSYKESWSSISNEGARQYLKYYPHDAKKELISSCMDAPDNFTEDYGSVLSIHTYSGLLIIKKGL